MLLSCQLTFIELKIDYKHFGITSRMYNLYEGLRQTVFSNFELSVDVEKLHEFNNVFYCGMYATIGSRIVILVLLVSKKVICV
jgi:hypothetical protein